MKREIEKSEQQTEAETMAGSASSVRKMVSGDIKQVAELEKLCFSSPWSEHLLEETLDSRFDRGFVLEENGRMKAYGILRILAGEGEIQRIGVHPSARRQKLGSKVMEAMTDYSRKKGVYTILLEVRESNEAARNLYKAWGFEEEGMRRDYYENPRENAILMGLHHV